MPFVIGLDFFIKLGQGKVSLAIFAIITLLTPGNPGFCNGVHLRAFNTTYHWHKLIAQFFLIIKNVFILRIKLIILLVFFLSFVTSGYRYRLRNRSRYILFVTCIYSYSNFSIIAYRFATNYIQ